MFAAFCASRRRVSPDVLAAVVPQAVSVDVAQEMEAARNELREATANMNSARQTYEVAMSDYSQLQTDYDELMRVHRATCEELAYAKEYIGRLKSVGNLMGDNISALSDILERRITPLSEDSDTFDINDE